MTDSAGFERAKNAFCTFNIKDGILSTNDFQTSTTSLNFAGDGSVDLKERTLDMTMRMNARGLLGLLTLPLAAVFRHVPVPRHRPAQGHPSGRT